MSYDLGTAHGKIVLDYNSGREVDRAEADIDRLERKSKDSDKSVGKLGKSLGMLGKGVSLVGLVSSLTSGAASAAAMGIQILGMIPNLASLLSLSAALPAIFAAGAVSLGVMKAALLGVSDAVSAAFSAETPAEFAKAIENLSPRARSFATALRTAAPALKQIQQGIQDAFFENGFEGLIPRLVAGLKGMQPVLRGIAFDFGELAEKVASFILDSDSSWEFIENATVSLRAQLAKLYPTITPILEGLRSVGVVGLPLMDRLGTAVAGVAARFGVWLGEITSDGRLQAWIETALQTLSELGALVSNVGAIFGAVFRAANETGGGLLGTLAQITGEFAEFLESADGFGAMVDLFAGILSVASQLAPVITTLVGALAKALAPALAQIATQIGPILLDVVQRLAPAFAPLAAALANVLTAVAPLLPPLASLVALLVTHLANALTIIASELGPVIDLLGGAFSDALDIIAPALIQVSKSAIPLAAALGQDLMRAVAPLAPVIVTLAQAFADELVPILPQLVQLMSDLVPSIVELASAFSDGLVASLPILIPLLSALFEEFVQTATVLTRITVFLIDLTAATIRFATAIPGAIGAVIAWFGRLPSVIGGALTAAWGAIQTVGAAIGNWFAQLPGRIGAFLAALPGIIGKIFLDSLYGAATILGFGIGLIVGLVFKLPQRIGEALADLGPVMWAKIQESWARAREQFSAGVNAVVGFARTLPGRTLNAIASLVGFLGRTASDAWNRAKSAFRSGVNDTVSLALTLPGRISRAVGNLGNLLYNAGRSVIQGLRNGISSGISGALDLVRNLGNQVKDAFNSALSIFSPSRVFFESGVNIDEGLILGIKKKLGHVRRMALALANTVIRPTVALPATTAGALTAGVAAAPRPATDSSGGGSPRNFGPYPLVLDGREMAAFVIDTVTGEPTVISKAADEGTRRGDWAGSGRRGRG